MKNCHVAVLGINASGNPDVWQSPLIELSEEDYAEGDHFDQAFDLAEEDGFDAQMTIEVETEMPKFLALLNNLYGK